ncbi:head GIN domain-containing protein [Haliea atlantica]
MASAPYPRQHFPASVGGRLPTALALCLAGLLLALPSAAETRRVQGLAGVQSVQIFGAVEVEISQGPEAELLFRGEKSRLSPPPFYRSDNTLVLGRSAEAPERNIGGIQYRLSLPSLEALQILGSADVYLRPLETPLLRVTLEGSADLRLFELTAERAEFSLRGSGDLHAARLRVDDLQLSLAGSGDLMLGEVQARWLRATINGSGDIAVTEAGWSDRLDVSVLGSGDADFRGLDGTNAEVNIIGSGEVRLGVLEALEANILGSGDVIYRGEPQLEQRIIGSGSLSRKP